MLIGAMADGEIDEGDARQRILRAAAKLVARGGVAALTTRAAAAAAGVQAPTLYRIFGDKTGLLHALAEHEVAAFVARKQEGAPHPDPVQDLRHGWDLYVAFGLANPGVFAIISEIGAPSDRSAAAQSGIAALRARVDRIARAGRLMIPVERAVALVHAAGLGTVATLLAESEQAREPALSALAREAVISAIISDSGKPDLPGAAPLAIGLRAHLNALEAISPGERLLLDELLARIAATSSPSPGR